MYKAVTTLIALSLISINTARADAPSGNDLLTLCSSGNESSFSTCKLYVRGYVEGFEMALTIAGEGNPTVKQLFCSPEGVTPDQMARVLVKWLRANPKLMHYSANVVIPAAMAEAFPCPAPEPKAVKKAVTL